MTTDIAAIAAGMSKAQRAILSASQFVPKGWEPPNPFHPPLSEMVESGLFRRADGRCGYERFKDSFLVPTPLGLAVRTHLLAQGEPK
jgi:hypothetical protein